MNPLISIITVNYNGGDSLERTMQSVFQQTYKNYEYIVVDGASKDNSFEIITRHSSQLAYFVSEPDKGVYDAMNKALTKCKGEWVYFLNSKDTFIDQHVLSNVASNLERSGFSVVAGYVQTVEPDIGLYPKKHVDGSPRLLFNTHFCHQALFVRREAYLKQGMYDPRFRVFADFHTIYRIIADEGGYEKVEQVFALYDLGGISANWRKSVKIFREREVIFAELGDKASFVKYLFGYLRALGYYIKKAIL